MAVYLDLPLTVDPDGGARKVGNRSCFLTILYDDLLRKNWMMRASRKDPTLNLMNEAMTVDKQIKAAAEQRLGFVLQAANIRFPNNVRHQIRAPQEQKQIQCS